MDDFYRTLFGALFGNYDKAEKIGCDTVGKYTIDTCHTIDHGWETAVWKDNNPMIIVARYENKEAAKAGHEDWCIACSLNPTCAWSVQLDEYVDF